jgi:hypothetical protein
VPVLKVGRLTSKLPRPRPVRPPLRRIRIVTSIVGVLLVSVALINSDEALAGRRKVSDQWTASAPIPTPYVCRPAALEGISRESHHFSARFHGTLKASMTGFIGDWNLYVVSEETDFPKDTIMAGSETLDEKEQVQTVLAKGWKVNIMACNSAGGPSAELSLEFQEMRKCEMRLRC